MKKTIIFTSPFRRNKTGEEVTIASAQAKVIVEVLGKARYQDKAITSSPVTKTAQPAQKFKGKKNQKVGGTPPLPNVITPPVAEQVTPVVTEPVKPPIPSPAPRTPTLPVRESGQNGEDRTERTYVKPSQRD